MRFRTIAVFSFLIAFAVALAGCQSTDVTSVPDTMPPLPPGAASGVCKDLSRVVLTWQPNQEADLAGYNVYQMSPPRQINTSLVRQTMFVTLPTTDAIMLYRVTAVDRSGNESAPSQLVRVPLGVRGGADVDPPVIERDQRR